MKFYKQKTHFSCGAACFRNLLSLWGCRMTEKKARRICNTNRLGTDEKDLMSVCKYMKYNFKELKITRRKYGSKAFCRLIYLLKKGYKVILCVDNFSHWVLAIGHRKRKIIIVDSEKGIQLIKYFNRERLLNRWWGSDKKCFEKSQYYGLAIKR